MSQKKISKNTLLKIQHQHSSRNVGNKPFDFHRVRYTFGTQVLSRKSSIEVQDVTAHLNININPQMNTHRKKNLQKFNQIATIDLWKERYQGNQKPLRKIGKSFSHLPQIKQISNSPKKIIQVFNQEQLLLNKKNSSVKQLNQAILARKILKSQKAEKIPLHRATFGSLREGFLIESSLKKKAKGKSKPRKSYDLEEVQQDILQRWEFLSDAQQSYIVY